MRKNIGQSLEASWVQEPLSPWHWGVPPSQHWDVFSDLEVPQNPVLLGFVWRLHHVDMLNHSLNLQALFPFPMIGVGAESSKFLIMAWSFW